MTYVLCFFFSPHVAVEIGLYRLFNLGPAFLCFFKDHLWSSSDLTPGHVFGTFKFDDHGFLACPTDEKEGFPYRVFVGLDSLSDSDVPLGKKDNCIGFEASTISYGQKVAACQYI